MTTAVVDQVLDLADPFDLDVKIDFDATPVTDVLSSVACGASECCTSWWNCPGTCNTCWGQYGCPGPVVGTDCC